MNRIEHVLLVSPSGELGGAERVLLDCVAALRDARVGSVSVVSFAEGPMLERVRQLGATASVLPLPPGSTSVGETHRGSLPGGLLRASRQALPLLRFARRLSQLIARSGADVVHTNGIKAHFLGALATPRDKALVVHLHDFVAKRPLSRLLFRALVCIRRRKTLFVANSRAVGDEFQRLVPGALVRVVHNAVDIQHFAPGPGDSVALARAANLPPPEPFTVSFGLVATYAAWKGHSLFIEAARMLRDRRPELSTRFYLVGGPIYATKGSQLTRDALLAQISAARLELCVGLVPFQADVADIYRALNVVVHASTEPEPFGLVIVEAMSCGRAVIVSSGGGAAELFQHGENALGFEPGNVVALAAQMERLATDAVEREALGVRARAHVVTNYNRERLAGELVDVYLAALRPLSERPGATNM